MLTAIVMFMPAACGAFCIVVAAIGYLLQEQSATQSLPFLVFGAAMVGLPTRNCCSDSPPNVMPLRLR